MSNISLTVRNLYCERGDRELFRELSFTVSEGSLLQVHGANGSGKTTLLRALCGWVLPDDGEILWCNTPIQQDRSALLRDLQYIGHLPGIKAELSPLENLAYAAAVVGQPLSMDPEQALERVELYGFEEEPAYTLSAGQKRRIALARLLSLPGKLWILDEPFNALDKSGITLLESLIDEHLQNRGIIVLASHMTVNLNRQATQSLQLHN